MKLTIELSEQNIINIARGVGRIHEALTAALNGVPPTIGADIYRRIQTVLHPEKSRKRRVVTSKANPKTKKTKRGR